MTAAMHATDESNIGIWLWIILILFIVFYVTIADVWLHHAGHEYMTTEFKEGLKNVALGPILSGLWFGAWLGLSYHFYIAP